MRHDLTEKRLCIRCITEPHLISEVTASGEEAECDYCEQTEMTETLADLADRFEVMFDQHFEREGEPDFPWESPSGESAAFIIADTAGLEEEPAADIQAILADRHDDLESRKIGEATAYDSELTYVASSIDDHEFRDAWADLETDLKTRRRFFSSTAEEGFDRLFADVHQLTTQDGKPVVRTIGPDTDLPALFRARAFQSDERFEEALLDPERFVGTPASRFAKAGRMNPQGVPVFYGATTEALTLAEVRPPVGSRVIVGRFDLAETRRVLDVDALESVLVEGSLFDPTFVGRLGRGAFLARLARRIRMPVMPDDEANEYLITQVMADYLAERVEPPLDGIAYSSAQGVDGAVNVALFNGSARVADGPVVPGGVRDVHQSGGYDDEPVHWVVWTEIDSAATVEVEPPPAPFAYVAPPAPSAPFDLRPVSLTLDRASLQVHEVRRIDVTTEASAVQEMTWDVATAPF